MNKAKLDEAIYERFIKPTKRKGTKLVGLEFELPIVNYKNEPVDFDVVHKVTDAFIRKFSFRKINRDDDGFIYTAIDEGTGDGISFDCSYNTLEFSFGTETDMSVLYERFAAYYRFVQSRFGTYDHALTGMGINPHHMFNKNIPVVSERYRMLLHHLSSFKEYGKEIPFHSHPNFGLFSCASQIQMDVEEEMLVETLNTFTKLEPFKALILANSPWGKDQEFLCYRDILWRNSLHGLNRHNVDMYGLEFESVEEILLYIQSMSLYCVERNGKYINFRPVPLTEYFSSEEIKGEYFDDERYQEVRIHPELTDLQYLRSFKFEDLTFRGTVEFRSVCEQPVKEIMTSAALHAGLMESIHSLTELLVEDHIVYHKGYNASELRRMFVKKDLPDIFDWKEVSSLVIKILEIARDGLHKRGFGEEKYIDPLYRRAESLLSPAREMAEGLQAGRSLEDYIEEYGRL